MQLNEYAKYQDTHRVVRELSPHIKVTCYDEDLHNNFYDSKYTRLFISCTLLIPIFFITIISVVVRSLNTNIIIAFEKPINNGNLSAMILIGIFGEFVILGMDIAAVIYVFPKTDDTSISLTEPNLYVAVITLGFDSLVLMCMLTGLLYLCCSHLHKDMERNCFTICERCKEIPLCCLQCCLPLCLTACFYVVFGKLKDTTEAWKMPEENTGESINATDEERQKLVTKESISEEAQGAQPQPSAGEEKFQAGNDSKETQTGDAIHRTQWIMLFMLVAPLFSIASHSGYILVAWITEPSKATSVALILTAISVYSFLLFRQCYVVNAAINMKCRCWSICILLWPIWQVIVHIACIVKYCSCKKCEKAEKGIEDCIGEKPEDGMSLIDVFKGQRKEKESSKILFNTQAFCITIPWGILSTGSLAMVIISFYDLPVQTLDIVEYLLSIFQVFIVVIALLVTYKVFMLSEPEMQKFFKYLNKQYRKGGYNIQPDIEGGIDCTEESGAITGKYMAVLVKDKSK